MDERRFDELAMTVAHRLHRRSFARLLAAGALGALAGRLWSAEEVEAGRRPRRRCEVNADCRGTQICSTHGRCVAGDRCGDLVPPCAGCQEPRCDTATGEYRCTSTCDEEAGEVCCNGLCEPACDNGCRPNPGEQGCPCTRPPDGEVYCAESNRCGPSPCSNGCDYNSSACKCDRPPAGWAYCPAQNRCVRPQCPEGGSFNASLCKCDCPGGGRICIWDNGTTQRSICCPADGDYECCGGGGGDPSTFRCCKLT